MADEILRIDENGRNALGAVDDSAGEIRPLKVDATSGRLLVSFPETITGNLTITGDLTVQGNFNFGDAGVDIMTIAGYIQGTASGNTSVNVGNGSMTLGTPTVNDLLITGRAEIIGDTMRCSDASAFTFEVSKRFYSLI